MSKADVYTELADLLSYDGQSEEISVVEVSKLLCNCFDSVTVEEFIDFIKTERA